MNPELQKAIAKMLEAAQDIGAEAMNQLPAVFEEIIRWEIASNAVGTFVCLLLLGVGVYILIKKPFFENGCGKKDCFPSYFVGGAAGFLGGVLIVPVAAGLIKALLAPRLVIIDYLGKLL